MRKSILLLNYSKSIQKQLNIKKEKNEKENTHQRIKLTKT